jgi:thiol-disulfide isomerase/thioredoxin
MAMSALKEPRFWLLLLGAIGALAVVYVILASSAKPDGERGVALRDPRLLVGAMARFEYALMPREAPDIAFEHEGRETRLAAFRGQVVLVNFWATWCPPCLKELPTLDRLQSELGGADFQVVAIAADTRGPQKAQEFLDRLGVRRLELYADPRLRLAGAVVGANLPVSILYDREGREIGRLVGEADWASEEAKALVRAATAQ